MKMFIALFTTVLSLSAFASIEHHPTPPQQSPAPLMLGQWKSTQAMAVNGIWIHTRFTFEHHTMTMYARCQFGPGPANNLTVGVRSHTAYNGNYIYIHDNVSAVTNDNLGRYCQASLSPSTWEFYFQNAEMTQAVIFAPVPYQWRISVVRVP